MPGTSTWEEHGHPSVEFIVVSSLEWASLTLKTKDNSFIKTIIHENGTTANNKH